MDGLIKPLSRIFTQICENPEDRVCDCWTEQGWDISFRRMLNDWEN